MRRAAVGVLLLVLLSAGVAVASSPPTALCGICGDEGSRGSPGLIEHPALENATSGDSSVTVQVWENGSSRWTERLELDQRTAETLVTNPSLRRQAIEDSFGRYVLNEPATFESSIENRTLQVRYRVADSGHQGVEGVLLFDQFHLSAPWYDANADRVVIRGPPGTTVVNEPPTGIVENGPVVYGDGIDPTSETYIAFASDDGLVTDYAAGLAMALNLGPVMFAQAIPYAGVLSLIWGLVGAGTVVHGRNEPDTSAETPATDRAQSVESPSRITALSVGTALLCTVPVLLLLRLDYHLSFFPALAAIWVFWYALGTARTTPQRWGSIAGLVIAPIVLFLSVTPLSGLGGILLFFLFVAGLVATPFGFALYWLANRSTPSPKPDD